MLQGTTTVQLTDVSTGAVETHESHNMITNAPAEFLKRYGDSGRIFSASDIPYRTLFGGLLIFDSQIPAAADQLQPPGEAKMIGCGQYGVKNTSTAVEMGDFNADESILVYNDTDKYARMVWDFSSSKANGNIGSICLTHINGGIGAWGLSTKQTAAPFSTYQTITCNDVTMYLESGEAPFYVDLITDTLYTYEVTTGKIIIRTRRAGLQSISLLKKNGNSEVLERKEYEFTALSNNSYQIFFDCKNKILYGEYGKNAYVDGSYKTTHEFTAIDISAGASSKIVLEDTSPYSDWCTFLINDGYAYESKTEQDGSSKTRKRYRFPLSDPSAKELIEWGNDFNSQNYRQYGDYLVYQDLPNILLNTKRLYTSYVCYKNQASGGWTALSDNGLVEVSKRSDSTLYIHKRTDYLATINNQTGIVKTPEKTMKITYELREVAS